MKTWFRIGLGMAVLMLASVVEIYAQNIFFPTKEGTVLVYQFKKKGRDKVTHYSRLTIKNVKGTETGKSISYVTEILNINRNPLSETPVTGEVTVKNDVITMDMSHLLLNMPLAKATKVEITGIRMELPANLQPGQSIKDSNMTIIVDMGISTMKTSCVSTGGKCEAIEDVTVSAGTFKCYKITQTVATTIYAILNSTTSSRSAIWYAPGIGTVKNEQYDDKGKVERSMELAEVN